MASASVRASSEKAIVKLERSFHDAKSRNDLAWAAFDTTRRELAITDNELRLARDSAATANHRAMMQIATLADPSIAHALLVVDGALYDRHVTIERQTVLSSARAELVTLQTTTGVNAAGRVTALLDRLGMSCAEP